MIEEVATNLNVSYRTLNRRLKAMGTTFKDLVIDTRHKLAVEYLARDQYSVDQIADALGHLISVVPSRAGRR